MTARQIFNAIPPVARPLLVLVVPAVLLHQIFVAGSETAAPVAPQPLPAISRSAPTPPAARQIPARATRLPQDSAGDFPRAEELRTLLEQNSAFLLPKRAACPVTGPLPVLERYPLFKAFRAAGYLDLADSGSWQHADEIHVDLTPAAVSTLGNDLREGPVEISVMVAKKEFIEIVSVEPPPQPLAMPIRNATRVDFTWRWAPANALAGYLNFLADSNGIAATAYVERGWQGQWRILDINFHDTSPDLMMRR